MEDCLFCRIAAGKVDSVIVYEDREILAFLDVAPIRRGHTQIIPREHYETFDVLPSALAHRILDLGQQLARRLKQIYAVERVGFLFTGGDVAHAHAHVVPIHQKGDITSGRYMLNAEGVEFGSNHLRASPAMLSNVRNEIGRVDLPSVTRSGGMSKEPL